MGDAAFNAAIWIGRMMFIIAVVFSILLLTEYFFNLKTETTDLRIGLFINRVFYSPNGISYTSPETGRSYPGIIDLEKFSSGNLEKAMFYGDEKGNAIIAAVLTLLDRNDKEIKSIYYNENTHKNIFPVSFASGYARDIKKFYVLIYDNGKLKSAKLEMDIVTQKG